MNFAELSGNHLVSVDVNRNNHEVLFTVKDMDGNISRHIMWHSQFGSEGVTLEDIIGDINDLQDAHVIMAEVSTNDGESSDEMWTFYRIQTNKGHVDFRWFGESNGYYSVEVDFDLVI